MDAIAIAVEVQPKVAAFWVKQAECLLAENQAKKAIEKLAVVRQQYPQNIALAGIHAEAYLRARDPNGARAALTNFASSRDPRVVTKLHAVAKARNDRAETLQHAATLVDIEPGNASHHVEHYKALLATRNLEGAYVALQKAIELGHPDSEKLKKELGKLKKYEPKKNPAVALREN